MGSGNVTDSFVLFTSKMHFSMGGNTISCYSNLHTVLNYLAALRIKCPYSELFWSAFVLHFPAFGLNTERYSVSPRIPSKCGKMREKCGPE